jgi:hypothetical protein
MANDRKAQAQNKASSGGGIRRLVPLPRAPDPSAGEEHRGFPRSALELKVSLRRGDSDDPNFAATLRSDNVSMSGVFLLSTFFLPLGTSFDLSFKLPNEDRPVLVRAELVRHQHEPTSGMGLHFQEFFGQTEVALARLFLDERVEAFTKRYLDSPRSKGLKTEAERMVDALVAWELDKVTTGTDPWAP